MGFIKFLLYVVFVDLVRPIFACYSKLDGVGPVDNRLSAHKVHHFIEERKKKEEKCDMGHMERVNIL